MAISNRTATTANSGAAAAASLTINTPTGVTAGDFMVAVISINNGSTPTITAPSGGGWNLLNRANNTTVLGQAVYWKIAGASEPGSYQWTNTSEFISGVMNCYTGVDNNNPIAGFTALGKTTASTSATFGACIPQAETVYPVLLVTSRNTTAAQHISTASGGYAVDGDTSTTATDFIEAAIQDQASTIVIPVAAVTPGSATLSTTSTDVDTVLYLRPDISTVTTLATDVATYAQSNSSPVTSLNFGTGYVNEYVFLFISENSASFSETCSVSGTTLSWSLVARANDPANVTGSSEVWVAKAATPLAFNSEAVTVTPSTAGSAIQVGIFSFINSGGAGASNTTTSASGTPSLGVTTTGANSWVWATLMDVTAASTPSLPSGQTRIEVYKPSGESMWVWRETATTSSSGTLVTLNVTAPTGISYSMVVAEILTYVAPSGGGVNQHLMSIMGMGV